MIVSGYPIPGYWMENVLSWHQYTCYFIDEIEYELSNEAESPGVNP